MLKSDWERLALIALKEFAVQVTVPVLYDDPGGVDQVGTGTLFTLDGRYFLGQRECPNFCV